jgi:ribonuclease Z
VVGLRQKARGDKTKPLSIIYPRDNRNMAHLIDCLSRIYGTLKYPLSWVPIDAGEKIPLSGGRYIESFAMKHQPNATTLGYKVVERRRKLKPEYVGMDIPALLKSGAVQPRDLNVETEATVLAYCLDNCGFDTSVIKGAELAILDSTFLDPNDRDGENEKHSTIYEAAAQAIAAEVKEVCFAHISTRYDSIAMEKAAAALKEIDFQIPHTVCPLRGVIKL